MNRRDFFRLATGAAAIAAGAPVLERPSVIVAEFTQEVAVRLFWNKQAWVWATFQATMGKYLPHNPDVKEWVDP